MSLSVSLHPPIHCLPDCCNPAQVQMQRVPQGFPRDREAPRGQCKVRTRGWLRPHGGWKSRWGSGSLGSTGALLVALFPWTSLKRASLPSLWDHEYNFVALVRSIVIVMVMMITINGDPQTWLYARPRARPVPPHPTALIWLHSLTRGFTPLQDVLAHAAFPAKATH